MAAYNLDDFDAKKTLLHSKLARNYGAIMKYKPKKEKERKTAIM